MSNADYPVPPELKSLFDELAGFEHSADGQILRGFGQVLQRHAEMVRAEIEAETVTGHRLTDEEFDAWQAAIRGCRDNIGGKWDAPETSPYARLYAYAERKGGTPSPADVRELLGAYNATTAMNRVYVRGNSNYRRRVLAVAALADTDEPVDPEALRRALAVGTRDEGAANYPSTAQLRQWIADLQGQLDDAREEIEFLQRRATEH